MTTPDMVAAASNVATTISVAVGAVQLWLVRRQSMTTFEDSLVKEYRELAAHLPTKALLGERLTDEEHRIAFHQFYRYFDLCNQQVFLHARGRISERTWTLWREGIVSNIGRPAFARAWAEITARANGDFEELRSLCPPPTSGPTGGERPVGKAQ